jgi:hypothetical protein
MADHSIFPWCKVCLTALPLPLDVKVHPSNPLTYCHKQRLQKVWHPQVYEKQVVTARPLTVKSFLPKGSPHSLSLHSLKWKVGSNHRSRFVDPLVVGAIHQSFTVHASIPERDLQGRELSKESIWWQIQSWLLPAGVVTILCGKMRDRYKWI